MENKRKLFSRIYDENIGPLYRFIFFKVNSEDIAQDLCSEAFTKVWNRFDAEDEIDNPRAFLYSVARNLVIDHYREKSKIQTVEASTVPIVDVRTNLEKEIVNNSDLSNIVSALNKIKPEYADLISYHYINDLTISEISQITGKSENNVRVTLHRAVKSLKSVIES